ncbi:MAG: DnaJ C-terminal domain-containing protein, partial [Berryella intestinalis]|nr:DnaJ C-terminal domain-containing protein [Berryella intestinalis]
AARGASVVVPVPEGGKVRVKVPAGTQDGTVLTLKGKGAPQVKGSGSGDLKIKVGVRVPTELSDEQRSAFEALAAAETKGIRPWE